MVVVKVGKGVWEGELVSWAFGSCSLMGWVSCVVYSDVVGLRVILSDLLCEGGFYEGDLYSERSS